jgi:hypothetical protein
MVASTEQNGWVTRVLGIAIPEARPGGTSVKFQALRLQWVQTRQRLGAEVAKLTQAILEQSSESEQSAEVRSGVGVLDGILGQLDERLVDALDELYVCDDDRKRTRLTADARAIINEYAMFVASDPLMRAIDQNPFIPVNIAAQATTTLQALARDVR